MTEKRCDICNTVIRSGGPYFTFEGHNLVLPSWEGTLGVYDFCLLCTEQVVTVLKAKHKEAHK